MNCKLCQQLKQNEGSYCVNCGALLRPNNNKKKTSNDFWPLILISIVLVLFVFFSNFYDFAEPSTMDLTVNQASLIKNLEKTNYKDFALNVPKGYTNVLHDDTIHFYSGVSNNYIEITTTNASYGSLRAEYQELHDRFVFDGYTHRLTELYGENFEYILMTYMKDESDKLIYIGMARYDEDTIWYFRIESSVYRDANKDDLADMELILLGAKRSS